MAPFKPLVALLSTVIPVVHAYYQGGHIYGNNFGIPGRNATFDYVVVGGGTAGLAIATRLAEDGIKSVAVTEAGGFYEQDMGNTSVVSNLGLVYDTSITQLAKAFPTVHWGLVTTLQAEVFNQTYHYWRGKTLGGSEVYQRRTKQSYNLWAELVGDSSYKWDSFMPFFRKSAQYPSLDVAKRTANASVPSPSPGAFDTSGGPLEVGYVNYPLQFGSWTKLAFQELGFTTLSDIDSGVLLGAQYTTQTIAPDMTRSSSQASYLMLPCNQGIVVSSGAINSPQLLMVSGIGPATTLGKFAIPVLVDLPGVGQNLWDHVLFPVTYQVNTQGAGRLNNPANLLAATEEYLKNRTSQLTNTGFDFVAWEKLPNSSRQTFGSDVLRDLAQFPPDWPEVECVTNLQPQMVVKSH